jgi:serine/threonine protein kinase/tetratricopeptide (TPR) repeat protein
MSASESRSAVVLELAEEFLERYRQGERPSLKEYIDRHPELAAEIKEVFPAMALMENVALADESLDGAATGPATPVESLPPQQLGDYRILREVGRGGMGIVYEAEQVSLGRHVALKVLPRQMFVDDSQRRRFEREAKAAAKLHHTNIVPVFGVGEHDGMPYYVMQFIQGLGLDDVLDELKRMHGGGKATVTGGQLRVSRKDVSAADVARSLLTGHFEVGAAGVSPPSESQEADAPRSGESSATGKLSDSFTLSSSVRLPGSDGAIHGKSKQATYWQSVAQIGSQVAEALEYAHKQGIQHRDIKPSNLLLDTHGTVWVTDFGLARADNEDHLTQTGDIVGTLRYLPPEAFEGRADKRSDIYSLGLTLYELLALRPAYDEKERHRLIKRVTREEPVQLDRLNRAIPRDLVTIIQKAIDREAGRRYQTAAEFAADLQRFLDDEPIQARRLSTLERLGRWCRHYPGVASLTGILFLLLVGVTVVSSLAAAHFDRLAQNERQARTEAEQAKEHEAALREQAEKAKQQAESNFAKARKAVDDYFTTVSESQLLQVPGMQPLHRNLLQSALTFYHEFLNERGDDPAVRGELAAAYLRLGRIQEELSDQAEARKAREQARELYEALTKTAPESVEWRRGLAQCYNELGRPDEAIALYEKLVQPGRPRFRKGLADAYNLRGNAYSIVDQVADALQAYQQSLTNREMLVRLTPNDPDAQRDLGQTLNNIGVLLSKKGRFADALRMYHRAAEHAEAAFAQAPQVIQNGLLFTLALSNIAWMERQLGHDKEALAAYQREIGVGRKLARDNPAVPSLHSGLVRIYRNLAYYQWELKQTEQYERTLRLAREAIDRLPSDGASALFVLACVRAECSTFLSQEKDKSAALKQAEQKWEEDLAMDALRKAVAAGFRDVEQLHMQGELNVLRGRDDFKALEADLAAREAAAEANKRKDSQEAAAQHPKPTQGERRIRADLAVGQHAIALVLLDVGKIDEAHKHLQEAVALREALANEEPRNKQYQDDLAMSRLALGPILLLMRARQLIEQNRPKEVEAALAKIDESPSESAGTWKERGRLYFALGQTDRAAADFKKAVEQLGDKADPTEPAASDSDKLFARLAEEALLVRLTKAIEDHPGVMDYRWKRGEWYARRGQWKEAAADFKIVLERQHPSVDIQWLHAAPVLVAAGDSEGYRWICRAMRKQFGDPQQFYEADRLAKACLLLPTAGDDTEWAGRMADRAAALGKNNSWAPYFIFCKGLADYRRGDFGAASEALDSLLNQIESKQWFDSEQLAIVSSSDLLVSCHAVLAMALHRQAKTQAARAHRAEAAKILDRHLHDPSHFPLGTFRFGNNQTYSHDWLIAWLMHREAKTLIEGKKAELTK